MTVIDNDAAAMRAEGILPMLTPIHVVHGLLQRGLPSVWTTMVQTAIATGFLHG